VRYGFGTVQLAALAVSRAEIRQPGRIRTVDGGTRGDRRRPVFGFRYITPSEQYQPSMAERNVLQRFLGPVYGPVRRGFPSIVRKLSIARTLLRRELTRGLELDLPWERRLWLYRRGFTSESGVLFGVDETNYRDVVSDLQHERADVVTEPWDVTVNNKLTFHLLFGSFPERLPTLYGLVDDGTLVRNSPAMTVPSWQSGDTDGEERTGGSGVDRFELVPWIDAHLDEADALVLKPVAGYGGHGFLRCHKLEDGTGYGVNGESKTPDEFASLVEGLEEYLAWDLVEPGAYLKRIYSGATGAVRVMTMWDYDRREPFVAGAAQRIASDRSAPIDSSRRGGLTAAVSEAGELSRAARWNPERGELDWHDHHPDTGARIEGARVSGWPTVREGLLEMAASVPSLPRLGWDVVVTGEGTFTVLEVNAHAGDTSVQMHQPLLRDPRVRAFYEHHGCL
jgi:hypothetical protein